MHTVRWKCLSILSNPQVVIDQFVHPPKRCDLLKQPRMGSIFKCNVEKYCQIFVVTLCLHIFVIVLCNFHTQATKSSLVFYV